MRHQGLVDSIEAQIGADWKEAVRHGSMNDGPKLDPSLMFDDVFRELPDHLRHQRDELALELQARAAAKHAAP